MIQRLLVVLVAFLSFISSLKAEDWDKRVYLASYPRSGNHWMRFLIEEATEITTGSVYCDASDSTRDYHRQHLSSLFPWGYVVENGFSGRCRYPKKDECVFLKTHYPYFSAQALDCKPYFKVIRIVRHPVDSFYSHYTRGKKSGEKVSPSILKEFIVSFRQFQEYWDKQPNVITIRYEDLYTDQVEVFKHTLQKCQYPINDSQVERACKKHPPQGGILKYYKQFAPQDLKIIEHELEDIMKKYNYPFQSK